MKIFLLILFGHRIQNFKLNFFELICQQNYIPAFPVYVMSVFFCQSCNKTLQEYNRRRHETSKGHLLKIAKVKIQDSEEKFAECVICTHDKVPLGEIKTCIQCKQFWCSTCDGHLGKCPFCRSKIAEKEKVLKDQERERQEEYERDLRAIYLGQGGEQGGVLYDPLSEASSQEILRRLREDRELRILREERRQILTRRINELSYFLSEEEDEGLVLQLLDRIYDLTDRLLAI